MEPRSSRLEHVSFNVSRRLENAFSWRRGRVFLDARDAGRLREQSLLEISMSVSVSLGKARVFVGDVVLLMLRCCLLAVAGQIREG